MGIRNGLILEGPRSMRTLHCSSIVRMPPIPLPTQTPTLFGSTPAHSSSLMPSPASFKASSPAAMAYRQKSSRRLASFSLMYLVGSKFLTSPAIWVRYADVSNLVTGPMPHLPSIRAFHVSSTLCPRQEIAPIPVTTTRLEFIQSSFAKKMGHYPCEVE